jgi:hypothetical protein
MGPGETASAVNVRAYTEGGIQIRTGLSLPILTVDSSVNSLVRMNDTTPDGPEDGYCLIIGTDSGSLFVFPAQPDPVAVGLSGDPMSIVPFRPNTSVQPWGYVADSSMGVTLFTKYALNDSSATFDCFGQIKVRSDGLVYKTGIKEPPLAPEVGTGNTVVVDSGPLLAKAIPWTNYAGQNPNYDYGETNGEPSPTPDGTAPFIVDCANASFITITALSGIANINGNPGATPATLGPSTAAPTNPGHYIQIAGSGATPATATVVTGAFTDGAGNVIPKGVAPLFVPSVVDVGAAFAGAENIQVPSGAQAFQIGINSTGDTFSDNSGQFEIAVQVTTESLPPNVGLLGPLALYYWGDSPTSGPVGSYIWKNPGDTGGGIPRSTSNAVGNTSGNSFIFDATFAAGEPGLPGTGTEDVPMQWYALSAESAVTGSSPVFPSPITVTYPSNTSYSNFNFVLYGKIYIPEPGQYTFVLTSHDDVIWGIEDAALISAVASGSGEGGTVGLSNGGQTITVAQGYPLLPRQNYTSGEGGNYAQTTVVVAFAAAGTYGIEIDYDYWFHSGRILLLEASPTPGAPPAIIPPLTQGVRTDVSYAYKYRSSLTGAQSNPSPTTTPSTTPVLANTLTPVYSPDPQVDKVDYYRQDQGLANFTYVATGPNTNPPTTISDSLTDAEAANNQQMTYTDYEPVPSIDLPQEGHCNVSGGVITTLDTPFNQRWLPGTVILIGSPTQLAYTFISRPISDTQVVIPGVPDGTDLVWNIAEPILANQPLPYTFGPTDNINFVFAVGDTYRPGTLYWCSGSNLDSWPDTNQFDVTDPSEALVNGAMSAGRGVLFSIRRAWIIEPNFYNALATVTGTSGSTWTLRATSIARGLFIPRCVAIEGGGNIFFRVDDGIHFSRSGAASVSITDETLYPLFSHEGSTPQPVIRNGVTYWPPDDSQPERQQFSIQNGYLYYDYAYRASNFPITESQSFVPTTIQSQGPGIPWQDSGAATNTGFGSNQVALITGFSISDGVVTFETANQSLVEGQSVVISGLGTGTYLNGETLTVESPSATSFQAEFAHADVTETLDFGQATPTTQFAYAQNVGYAPPAGQFTVFAFPAGNQPGVTKTSGTCFGASLAPWSFIAGNGYGSGVNGCPLFMEPAEWESTSVGIPSLPAGAVVQSIVPAAVGTSYVNDGGGATFFDVDYPSGSYRFTLNGSLDTGAPDLGTDLSVLNGTSFAVTVTNTEDSDPGEASTFGCDVSFYGVAINYTAPGTPISPTQLQTLAATNCGLNIPSEAPVTAVTVNLQTGMQYGAAATLLVQLTLNGAPVGSPKGLPVGPWATEYTLEDTIQGWGLVGLIGSQVNGATGLGVNVSGNLPQDAQVNLNDLNGEVFYTIPGIGEGNATLVYDIRAMGWVLDLYKASEPTVHAPNEGQSQQGTLVGCSDGTVRMMESGSPEMVSGLVDSPAIGVAGWGSAYEATFEYMADSGATVSFIAADVGNGSYAPDPIVLEGTQGRITKFTTKLSPNKWKLLQAEVESSDPTLQFFFDGCVLQVKPFGSNGAFTPVRMFRPSGGEGGQG